MAENILALFVRSGPIEDNAVAIEARGRNGYLADVDCYLIYGGVWPVVCGAACTHVVVTRIAVTSEVAYPVVDSISAQVTAQIHSSGHDALRRPLERCCLVDHRVPSAAYQTRGWLIISILVNLCSHRMLQVCFEFRILCLKFGYSLPKHDRLEHEIELALMRLNLLALERRLTETAL